MAIIKMSTNKCWQGFGERKPSYTVGGDANWFNYCGKQYGGFSKPINRTTISSSNHTPRHIFKQNSNSKRYKDTYVHCSTIYNSQHMGKTYVFIHPLMNQ